MRTWTVLECPARTDKNDFAYIIDPGTSGFVGTKAKVWWFHELVLNLSTTAEIADHYVNQTSPANDNWHYRVQHVVLPFESTGTNDKVVGWDNNALANAALITSVPATVRLVRASGQQKST